ncbi:homeobox protein vent1-like [Polyodon spathula]|uniref:homeobox protein vent1-like n=1 Tax=Polyodon spathula TaxID=7913 RepID=UPI001B7DDF28|nr:homeobox protein vent1-like [Polyodon spathula]
MEIGPGAERRLAAGPEIEWGVGFRLGEGLATESCRVVTAKPRGEMASLPPEEDHLLRSSPPPQELKLPPEGQLLSCPATPRAAEPAMPRFAETAMPSEAEPIMPRLACSAPPRDAFSESNGESSGYESETVRSDVSSPEGEGVESEPNVNRRMRTKFTPDQIHKLENNFSKHKYLGASERLKVAAKLHLSETQVKTWFQNRRMKLKREVQDLRPDFLNPALLPRVMYQPVSSLQHFSYPVQQLAVLTDTADNPAHCLYPSFNHHVPMQQIIFPQQPLHHLLLASQYHY